MSQYGNGSNSMGQFWYGSTTNFPGFLYKKNVGVGGRRSTKFAAGGNITCNSYTYLYNKYKPGQGGVGASSIANRRAKNRLATICNKSGENNCYPCYMTLGQYNRFLYNPNGFYPCPAINSYSTIPTPGPTPEPTVPSTPTLLTIISTDENLILNFILGPDGGSPIIDIEYSLDNGMTWNSSGETTSPFAITGLTNGDSYSVGIRSKNIYGTSSSSNFISAIPNPYIQSYLDVETTSWTALPGVTSVEYLVVGGGGGSGATHDGGAAGGGGGGMVLTGTKSVVPGTTYTVIVGDGGAGGVGFPSGSVPRETDGTPGEISQFDDIISLGGGGGLKSRQEGDGAGGAGASNPFTGSIGGNGGTFTYGGGGGGGSSGNGANGTTGPNISDKIGGSGGAGTSSNLSGLSLTYGVGGEGGDAQTADNSAAGATNTGNGSKAPGTGYGSQRSGAKGGSGIVILKF